MNLALRTLAGLIGIGLLTWFCTNEHKPMIEADLTSKTLSALGPMKISNRNVSADGQIITLRGVVPDEATKAAAGAAAYAVYGVSEVHNELEVKPGAVVMTTEERRAAVDCQTQFKGLLNEPIRFDTGSAEIHPASYPLMDKLAAAAKICPAASIEIGGHTDPRGALDMNMKLSQDRASSVKTYLESKGIAAGRLTAVGYGPTKPIADNGTPEGMQQNRRTEFNVKGL